MIYKVGYGGRSTVWRAIDTREALQLLMNMGVQAFLKHTDRLVYKPRNRKHRFVAIQIATAESSIHRSKAKPVPEVNQGSAQLPKSKVSR